ncbi:MAG: radical SAM protein [Nanoarchaeota archaeon]|nr:radical SAM protein [Nanoarchaeota archaeon]
MKIERLSQGRNSVLFDSPYGSVLYEKLSNTIHAGRRTELEGLQSKTEGVDYHPIFETETLQGRKSDPLEGLILNVTERCNFSCNYCIYSGSYSNERRNGASTMSFETAKEGIDLFMPRAANPALISFYGGEPLNNMDLIKRVIDYTQEEYPSKQTSFSMTTNFYDVGGCFEDIIGRRINLLVSLDGPREIHDRNRVHQNGNPTWERIMENLFFLERCSPGYLEGHVGASVTCARVEDLERIVKFFMEESPIRVSRIGGIEQKGLKNRTFENPFSSVTSSLSSEFLDYVTRGEMVPDVYRLLFEQQLVLMTMRSKEKIPGMIKLAGTCYPGKRKLFVDTDGKFYMCEKFGRRMPIGDTNGGTSQILIDDAIEEFARIRNNVCTNDCWAQRICSPCIQSAKDVNGGISEEGLKEMCKSCKSNLLVSLGIYSRISQLSEGYLNQINMDQTQLNKPEVKTWI